MSTTSRIKNDEINLACKTFREYRYRIQDTKSIKEIREAFTSCQKEIQRFSIGSSMNNLLKQIHTVLNSNKKEFENTPWDPPLRTYSFFEYLQNLLVSILQKVGEKNSLSEIEMKMECFITICSLTDIFNFNFAFNDKFLNALKQYLIDIRENQYSSNDYHYEMIASLFEQIYTIEKFQSIYQNIYQKLYPYATTSILQCILNYYDKEFIRFYTDEQGRRSRTDNDAKHRVFLNIFPEYLLSDENIVKPILTTSQLDKLCQTLFNWSHTVFHHIFQNKLTDYILSNVLTRFFNLMNYCISSIYFRRCIRQNLSLIENILRLLRTPLFISDVTDYDARFGKEVIGRIVRKEHIVLVIATVTLFYNLSIESCVVDHLRTLKNEDKPEIINILYEDSKKNNNNNTIKFYCETLIGLMNDDIDNLKEPKELATSYVQSMSKAVNKKDHSAEKIRLSDAIIHLKIFIQNEEVKTEIVAQDGLTILTKCATEHRFDMASIQYPSMELIWSIIFNLSAAQLLRANKVFVDYIVNLTKSTADQLEDNDKLKSVAEGIDWQIKQHVVKSEKQKESEKPKKLNVFGVPIDNMGRPITKEQRLSMEQGKEYKFELMISYCHKDGDLCTKIHKYLKDTTNARIWIDREQMFGSLTERMSEAIEHSRIILICYSNAYKESANCQAECTYANDLKRIIIPLRMESNYRPNGWLKIIIGDRLYVDFAKYEFEKAFKDLIKQLERHDKKYKEINESHAPVNASASVLTAQSQKKTKEIRKPSPPPPPPTSTKSQNIQVEQTEDQLTSKFPASTSYQSKQITDWTNEDVQKFFYDKHIEPMLNLFHKNTNGNDLLHYYKQLKTQGKQYDLLKEELKETNNIHLPFQMFVTFDKELERLSSTNK